MEGLSDSVAGLLEPLVSGVVCVGLGFRGILHVQLQLHLQMELKLWSCDLCLAFLFFLLSSITQSAALS